MKCSNCDSTELTYVAIETVETEYELDETGKVLVDTRISDVLSFDIDFVRCQSCLEEFQYHKTSDDKIKIGRRL